MPPVAVVGAGLAGSLLSLALARRGRGCILIGPAAGQAPPRGQEDPGAATALSYGGMAGLAAARAWRQLERSHGPLGWSRSRLLLHGWPAPWNRLPVSLQGLATAWLPCSRVDAVMLAARLPEALAAAGVVRLETRVQAIHGAGGDWRVSLADGGALEADQLVLAAGSGCRSLLPDLPQRLRFSWAGVIVVAADALSSTEAGAGWLQHARAGGIVQPLRWQRPALEARAAALSQEAWIVDAGLAPWGEAVLLGQITLVAAPGDPGHPPDPQRMECLLREGLHRLDPALAALPGSYRQVAVPFCSDGRPLVGPLPQHPGLWAFTGFSGAFSTVPALAEQLAESLTTTLAEDPDSSLAGG